MQKIRGAIQGIDDPGELARSRMAGLLREEGVVRVTLADAFQDGLLGGLVHLGDVVVASLRADLELIEARQGAHSDVASAARGLYGGVEQGLHGAGIVQSAGLIATGSASGRHTMHIARTP